MMMSQPELKMIDWRRKLINMEEAMRTKEPIIGIVKAAAWDVKEFNGEYQMWFKLEGSDDFHNIHGATPEQVKESFKNIHIGNKIKITEDQFKKGYVLSTELLTSTKSEPKPKVETIKTKKPTEEKTIYNSESFREMQSTKLETAKKGPHQLTYASWAEAWSHLKELHPNSNYTIHEQNGMPYFCDNTGAFVKVSVEVLGLTHTVFLPVMDYNNNPMKKEPYSIKNKASTQEVKAIDTFAINKNIQRAFTKAIAMHGIGLYVFKGEDYPEE